MPVAELIYSDERGNSIRVTISEKGDVEVQNARTVISSFQVKATAWFDGGAVEDQVIVRATKFTGAEVRVESFTLKERELHGLKGLRNEVVVRPLNRKGPKDPYIELRLEEGRYGSAKLPE